MVGRGEKVCVAVAPKPGMAVSGAALLAHLDAGGLSKFDMPEYFLTLDVIPMTATGKLRKVELRQAYGDYFSEQKRA